MENAQPVLTTATPLSFIILPTSSSLQNLQPLTVITTTALNSLQQGTNTQGATPTFNVCSQGNTPTTLTALPLVTSCLPTTLTTNAANNVTMASIPLASIGTHVTSTGSISTTKTGYSTGTPPLKPAKKFRSEQEEILRCKRRLDFVGSLGLQRPHATTVLRRNERERNRVKLINNTFLRLREHLPGTTARTSKGKTKKLSKVDTLQRAIDYIHALQNLIDEHDAVNAVFDQQERTSGYTSSTISGSCASSTSSASSVVSEDGLLSPGSAGESEMLSDEAPLSPEEADLLDFTNWFCP